MVEPGFQVRQRPAHLVQFYFVERTRARGKPGPGRGKKNEVRASDSVSKTPTPSEIGISKNDSSKAQFLATLPEFAPYVHGEPVRVLYMPRKKAFAAILCTPHFLQFWRVVAVAGTAWRGVKRLLPKRTGLKLAAGSLVRWLLDGKQNSLGEIALSL